MFLWVKPHTNVLGHFFKWNKSSINISGTWCTFCILTSIKLHIQYIRFIICCKKFPQAKNDCNETPKWTLYYNNIITFIMLALDVAYFDQANKSPSFRLGVISPAWVLVNCLHKNGYQFQDWLTAFFHVLQGSFLFIRVLRT